MLSVIKAHTPLEINLIKSLMLAVAIVQWAQNHGLSLDEKSMRVFNQVKDYSKVTASKMAPSMPELLDEVVEVMETGVLFND